MAKENIIEVQNLKTYFHTPEGIVKSVDGVSFSIEKGKTMALVGESGCGKTQTSLSLIRLLAPTAKVSADKIEINGKETKDYTKDQARGIRGKDISMIFQEPMTSLNPVITVGKQLMEVFRSHEKMTREEAWKKSVEALELVKIASPEQRMKEYPHQLSGGMRQRVMIAMALSCRPRLLIADEPTTALDVTIQAQILKLMRNLKETLDTSVMLITHDLGVVREVCSRAIIFYCGQVIEEGPVEELFENPCHPYTQGLLKSLPVMGSRERLYVIPGTVPSPGNLPEGCVFNPRCGHATEKCRSCRPQMTDISDGHCVRCWLYDKEG